MPIDIEVQGLKETQKKMTQAIRDLKGLPMLNGFRRATLWVLRDAKINAPVDTGRLRASLIPEIRFEGGSAIDAISGAGGSIFGVVGSNVVYAPFQEFGTTKMDGKHFLQNAFEANIVNITNEIGDAVGEIVEK